MKDRESMAGSTIRYIVMAILAMALLGKSEVSNRILHLKTTILTA